MGNDQSVPAVRPDELLDKANERLGKNFVVLITCECIGEGVKDHQCRLVAPA